MIICFYQSSLQLIISDEEGLWLFPQSEPSGEAYVRITGNWIEGLRIYKSNSSEYSTRTLPGVFYKLMMVQTSGVMGVANVGWGVLGPLKRSEHPVPCRGLLAIELGNFSGTRVIKVMPLNLMQPLVTRRGGRKAGSRNSVSDDSTLVRPKIIPPKRVVEVVDNAEEASDQLATPEQVEATPLPEYPEVVREPPTFVSRSAVDQPVYPPRPIATRVVSDSPGKSIEDLKELALELNKSLAANPSLYVVVSNNRLQLEEEIEEFEEF